MRDAAAFDDSDWWHDEDPPVQPLTREEAQALIARQPAVPIARLFLAQVVCGVLVALVWGGVSGSLAAAVSALYGGAVAIVPNALMARGVLGSRAGRSVFGLVFWEFLKMSLAGAMLALAPVWIKPLSWPALLVSLVLCLKVFGVALLLGRATKKI